MVDKILLRGRNEAIIYWADGRQPLVVTVDTEVLLDVVFALVYTKEAAPCTIFKAA